MVKKFGIAFLAILATIPLLVANNLSGGTYLDHFLREQSISVVATVLAVNVATVTFLIGILMGVEQNMKKQLFNKTRVQLKHNLVFMFVVFFLQTIFVILLAKNYSLNVSNVDINQVITFMAILCVVLVFFALLEIITALFKVSDFLKKN